MLDVRFLTKVNTFTYYDFSIFSQTPLIRPLLVNIDTFVYWELKINLKNISVNKHRTISINRVDRILNFYFQMENKFKLKYL
jgi:hypothetical protein